MRGKRKASAGRSVTRKETDRRPLGGPDLNSGPPRTRRRKGTLNLARRALQSLTMITKPRALVRSALSATLVLVGCQDYLFEQKFPERIKESQIVVPAAVPTPADILFVVDNSGSMADEQERLASNFDAFIREIAGAGDYQIGVVSTDLS